MSSLLVLSKQRESMGQTLDLSRAYASGQFLPIIGREIRGEELLISAMGKES
jgi:hypothetical protein